MAGLLRLLSALPTGWILGLGPLLGRVAHRLAGRERRRALGNLRHVWPHQDPAQQRELVARVFTHLGRSAMECVALNRRAWPRLGHPDGPLTFAPGSQEALRQRVDRGKGVLFVTSHLGNWELLGAAVARHVELAVLFRPSYDPRFTRLMEAFRQRSGIRSIDVSRPSHLVQVMRALGRGAVVGILLDQPVDGGAELPFFGHPAPTSTLVPALAARTGAAVVVGHVRRQDDGSHRAKIQPLDGQPWDDQHQATLELMGIQEQAIEATPEQWVWTLDRWRLERKRKDAKAKS